MLAAIVQAPELAISEDESKQLAGAAGNVLRHYDIKTTQKALDWTALGICAGSIYGARAVALSLRQREERRNRAASAAPRPGNGADIPIHRPAVVEWPPQPAAVDPGGFSH